MYASASNQLASWHARAVSSDIISRIRDIALASFSNLCQMWKSETQTNQINVKTDALISCIVLIGIVASFVIWKGRQNWNQVQAP
jgi:hypothetical protein